MEFYDLIIIGAGPAGLTAGIYAARYQLKTLVLGSVLGGTMSEAYKICNYPSWPEISGLELAAKFKEHALDSGVKLETDSVEAIEKEKELFQVETRLGKSYQAKFLILALGMKHRLLGLANEKHYLGRGLSYCFTCDGAFFKKKVVAVIGGSDAAVTAALYFGEICSLVYLVYRGERLRAEPIWAGLLTGKKNIKVIYNTNIIGLKGKEKLEKVRLDKEYQGKKELNLDGLFIEIGGEPSRKLTQMLKVEIDEDGYVKTDYWGKTSVAGIWAVGDLTVASRGFRQIITACSQGALAVRDVFKSFKQS